jgi:hypothetical protein
MTISLPAYTPGYFWTNFCSGKFKWHLFIYNKKLYSDSQIKTCTFLEPAHLNECKFAKRRSLVCISTTGDTTGSKMIDVTKLAVTDSRRHKLRKFLPVYVFVCIIAIIIWRLIIPTYQNGSTHMLHIPTKQFIRHGIIYYVQDYFRQQSTLLTVTETCWPTLWMAVVPTAENSTVKARYPICNKPLENV